METSVKIGERLNELMTNNDIDGKTLAKALEVSPSTISRWKNNSKYMLLSGALKIADYFHCSLDFLVGRSELFLDFTPQTTYPNFYENLRKIMESKHITRYEVTTKTKIKSSHFVDWNRGSDPHILSLIELADYLDVTLDCLVGREN